MALTITKAEVEGDEGIVWVESESMEELMSPQARQMAYKARVKMGMSNAGLDVRDVQAIDKSGNAVETSDAGFVPSKYRRIFVLKSPPV